MPLKTNLTVSFLTCLILAGGERDAAAATTDGQATEEHCLSVKREVVVFAQDEIFPLVDSESTPRIELKLVSKIKQLRKRIQACSMPIEHSEETSWNEDEFIELDAGLAFFQITFGQVAEENNPELTRILLSSSGFEKTVRKLKNALGLERQQ